MNKKPENRRNATIDDVAKLAGVSIATVSRALSKPEVVSQKTRDKVNAAVVETGYTQNTMARNLRLDRTGMIVVLVPDIGNPFFSEILSGVEEIASKQGYNILIGNTNNDPDREKIYANYVRGNVADGLLLLNGHLPVPEHLLAQDKFILPPHVAVCERIVGASCPTVSIDNFDAAKRATEFLIEKGHQDIVHVAGPKENILTADRKSGFFVALENARITENQNRIFYGDFSINSGKIAFKEILKRDALPSAIFCANDEMAIGVISEAGKQGYKVPNDFSVIGFDDIQISESISPPLTTIHQPRKEIGRQAMWLLLNELKGEADLNQKNVTLDTFLVDRKSVR